MSFFVPEDYCENKAGWGEQMNFMKTEYITGARLNNFFAGSRVNNFFAGLRANVSYIGIAGIAGLVLLGGGYTWVSNLSGPSGYAADSILNLDVILAIDEDDNIQVFGPQISSDSQAKIAANAVDKPASGEIFEFRLPAGLPTPVEELPLVADSRLYSAANQQQVSPEQASAAQGFWDLENETTRLKPSYSAETAMELLQSDASTLTASTMDIRGVSGKTSELVAPIPAVLSFDARIIRQTANVSVSNPQIAIASGLVPTTSAPVPNLPVGTGAQSAGPSQPRTIEQVLADPIRSANELLKSWQQLREQTAHEFGKLSWGQ
ncbi:hypothetical protein MNBD_ALPHA11-1957 [hydrothermal vent metagenome]|uniref:Uncharacterized protein n=1 Tax=hydrothermal vent metagenome TaxID=652676 RepID=A0A3B0U9J0_9ZZZZ